MAYKLEFASTRPCKIAIQPKHLLGGDVEFKLDFLVIDGRESTANDIFSDVTVSVEKSADTGVFMVSAAGNLYNFAGTTWGEHADIMEIDLSMVSITPMFIALVGGHQVSPVSMVFGEAKAVSIESLDDE